MPYLGNEPAAAYTSTTKDTFSGDASTTDFTMSKSANVNAVRVVVENVVQNPTVAYTCSGTTLSFTSAPPTGTNNIYVVHLGPPAATIAPPTTINNATTFTGGVTFKNGSPEDTDGGRESILTFKGVQSGEEESTLAQIQAAHDGSSDDEKGKISFKTNDGNDSNSPTERWIITSDGHFKAAVNGYGIDFSVSEGTGATSSVLDDYEEGVHEATFAMNGSGSVTMTRSHVAYTKVGRLVTITGETLVGSVSSPVGSMTMTLPFTIGSNAGGTHREMFIGAKPVSYHIPLVGSEHPVILGNSSAASITFVYEGDDAAFANYTPAANETFNMSFSYFTS